MDKNTSVLQKQPSKHEFGGFRYLKHITEQNTTPERLKWLWERLLECDYAFDDFTRGQVDFFLAKFNDESNEFFEIGDSGLVIIINPLPKGDALLHYVVWDHEFDLHSNRGPANELLDYLFYCKEVHHITGMIASINKKAVRYAIGVGMKFEGEIREGFLWKGDYYNILIYGILEREHRARKERG